jgi:hypothetical protein
VPSRARFGAATIMAPLVIPEERVYLRRSRQW